MADSMVPQTRQCPLSQCPLSLCALSLVLSACGHAPGGPDALAVYGAVVAPKTLLSERLGEPYQLSASEKLCAESTCDAAGKNCQPVSPGSESPLLTASDAAAYYGLRDIMDTPYSAQSAYASDLGRTVDALTAVMNTFTKEGFLDEVKRRGRTPSIMFDIDNTLEFSGPKDTDPTGDGPAVLEVVSFVNRWCFQDGVDCYFVTARPCEPRSVTSALRFLERELRQEPRVLEQHTYFSRNPQAFVCSGLEPNTVVAYKDVVRAALERERSVFWLMSIGDQLTDSLGEHSGIKVRLPNQFFHSDIVPNQFAPYGAKDCSRPRTIAPPRECAQALTAVALAVTSAPHCLEQVPTP